MPHLHSYGSGFLFLTAFLLPDDYLTAGDFVMAGIMRCFSISWIDISSLMTISLSPVLWERVGRLPHTEKQTT